MTIFRNHFCPSLRTRVQGVKQSQAKYISSKLKAPLLRSVISTALNEDLGDRGDVTSSATIPRKSQSHAKIIAKENGVFCGLQLAMEAFRQCDRKVKLLPKSHDSKSIRHGQVVLEIQGNTRSILAAERTALNFIQRLSGIATLTRYFVKKVGAKRVRILDTRKTTPSLRVLEKYAVKCGGGVNHRFGLYDMVLIKDNHLAALKTQTKHPIHEAVSRSRKRWPKLKIEVECDTLDQVREAIEAKPDMILLDNMQPSQLRRAVHLIQGRTKTEASGGISLRTISAIANTGVDFISIGAITHSAPSLDFSLKISPVV